MDLQPAVDLGLSRTMIEVRRVVPEFGILHQVPHHVDAKAVDAEPHPETEHVIHRRANPWIAPVEIGLLLEVRVVVILT